MNVRALTLLTGLIWLGAAGAATPPDPSVKEEAVETLTTVTTIATPTGAFAARSCPNCAEHFLSLTSDTKFLVGRTPVQFADFKAIAGEKARFMTVYYRVADNIVTRVVISAN